MCYHTPSPRFRLPSWFLSFILSSFLRHTFFHMCTILCTCLSALRLFLHVWLLYLYYVLLLYYNPI
jgi:hypothetical protein